MSARDLADTVRAKRRRELAEKLNGVVSWPTRDELLEEEWGFYDETAEFVNLCTPREIAVLERQAADAQAEAERNYLDYGVRIQAATSRADALEACDCVPCVVSSRVCQKCGRRAVLTAEQFLDIRHKAGRAVRAEEALRQTRELAKRAKSQAAAPDYDEEAIRDLLWATVDAALAAAGADTPEGDAGWLPAYQEGGSDYRGRPRRSAAGADTDPEVLRADWISRVGRIVDLAHAENLGGKHRSGFCEACADAHLVAQRACGPYPAAAGADTEPGA